MRSATRARCRVDRTACAWVKGRSIDPDPRFLLVADPDEVPPDVTPSDTCGVDRSHHGGDRGFAPPLQRYELEDPAPWDIARVVHEADLPVERHEVPEAPRPDAPIRGLDPLADDGALRKQTDQLDDGLHRLRRRARAGERLP